MPPHATVAGTIIQALLSVTFMAMILTWALTISQLRRGRPLLPPPLDRVVPWGAGSVLAVILSYFAVNFLVLMGYFRLTGRHDRPTMLEQMLLIAVINSILLIDVPLLLRTTSRARLADFGFTPRGLWRQVITGGAAFLLIAPAVYAVNGLAVLIWRPHKHPLEEMVRLELSAPIAYLAVLSAVVLAPAVEELIFRGIIQGWLFRVLRARAEKPERLADSFEPIETFDLELPPTLDPSRGRRLSHWPLVGKDQAARRREAQFLPIVLTSTLFAAVHAPQWPAPVAIFFLSMGLGLVYQRTGHLISSIVMHALFNGFSTMMLFYAVLNGAEPVKKAAPVASTVVRSVRLRTATTATPVPPKP